MHIPVEQLKAVIGRDIEACEMELDENHAEAAAARLHHAIGVLRQALREVDPPPSHRVYPFTL